MDPQVLVRRLAHHGLDGLVDAGGIGLDILTGEVLQRGADLEEVLAAFATVEIRDHRAAGHPRQLVRGGDGRGGVPEERHEHRVLAAAIKYHLAQTIFCPLFTKYSSKPFSICLSERLPSSKPLLFPLSLSVTHLPRETSLRSLMVLSNKGF